uniref:Ubiquitin-like protein ATG12 n=1 Tax=Nilaparvata lugens TaxID=108931 RepID=A0A5K6SEX7_NILLU|nr:autophagy-related protein 12 [Nilaparvata lugens]
MEDEQPSIQKQDSQEISKEIGEHELTSENSVDGSTVQKTADNSVDGTGIQKTKIDVLLKATGNAPIMKQKKWTIDPDKKIAWIIEFVKKYLKFDPQESLFLYVNQAFAPAPDQTVRNLYNCYGTDGKLILHYCKSQAWG